MPLERLLEKAWSVREKNFDGRLEVSTPSPMPYRSGFHENSPSRWANISVTGPACALRCEHCNTAVLERMLPARSPEALTLLGGRLRRNGCRGVLVSGGSLPDGSVPLEPYLGALRRLKELGLSVIVHTGLAGRALARGLASAGVDQVLTDIIGDSRTIREIYHLERRPADFRTSLMNLKDAGLSLAPHIVVGLYYGRVRGEYRALRYITGARPDTIVIVALTRIPGAPIASRRFPDPSPEDIARIAAAARILNPSTPVALGCVRPTGGERGRAEALAVRAGVNAVAFPREETVRLARSLGLKVGHRDACCSLTAR